MQPSNCIYSTQRINLFCNPQKKCPCDAFVERTPIGVVPEQLRDMMPECSAKVVSAATN